MQLDLPSAVNERRARDRWKLPRGAAFAVASCALVLVFAAAGAPIPLYTTYGHADGLIHEAFATTAVGYFVAAAIALVALVALGRLSRARHGCRHPEGLTGRALVSELNRDRGIAR